MWAHSSDLRHDTEENFGIYQNVERAHRVTSVSMMRNVSQLKGHKHFDKWLYWLHLLQNTAVDMQKPRPTIITSIRQECSFWNMRLLKCHFHIRGVLCALWRQRNSKEPNQMYKATLYSHSCFMNAYSTLSINEKELSAIELPQCPIFSKFATSISW